MKSKLLSVVLVTAMLLTMLPLGAMSVSAAAYDGLLYKIADGQVTITGNFSLPHSLVIPATIEGYPVTTIGNNAFRNCTALTSVTIPDSVTTIGSLAFVSCTALTSVTIPDSVTTIGRQAFHTCTALTSVTIGNSVTIIGAGVFYNCTALTSVTIGDSVTSIGDGVFFSCTALTSVTIPNSVTTIENNAFYNCTSLTTMTIPDSVTTIGGWAFENCFSLTDVYYGGSESDKENVIIGSSNDPLLNATWHYNTVNTKECFSDEVQHSVMDTANGNGLAFRFELTANGVTMINRTEADLSDATINYLGKDCKLIGMGAIITNDDTTAENLTLDAVNDFNVVDVPTVYLQEADEDSCAFATRIIDIPSDQMERVIYARPYFIVEVDGEQITVYGDVNAATCAEYL